MTFLLIEALKRRPVARTPVWCMRQAGRYLPEYRQLRQQAGGFLAMCKNPELACEITLQPLRRFDLDAAIIFSDILTIPDAMGLGLTFAANEGPVFEHPIRHAQDVLNIPPLEPNEDLGYVMQAIKRFKQERPDFPLLGFCGSPWTVATYMVEGRSSKNFSIIKSMLYREPALLKALLTKLTLASQDYLLAQIRAGADAVMIFDTWGGILTSEAFQEFSLDYMQTIVTFLKEKMPDIPVILFTKQGGQWLELLAQTGCDALSIDWTVDLQQARSRVGQHVALQGNLDPSILYATPSRIEQEVKALLAKFGRGSGHVFNLGHGIYPDIPFDNVAAMITAVRQFSPAYHS